MIFNPANSITMKHEPALGGGGGGDGSSIEVAKRPRGRPPGSKNRPKPPIIITRDSDTSSALKPHILEIPNGHDVIHSLQNFSRQKNLGLCVLAASGAVANLTLRQPPHPTASAPSGSAVGTVCFNGRFDILSMSATIMPPGVTAAYSPSSATVTVAAAAGQVIGGTLVGPMMAAGTVTVVAAGFENPSFIRLPILEEDELAISGSLSGGGEDKSGNEEMDRKDNHQDQRYIHREYSHPPQQQQSQQQQRVMTTGGSADTCGVGMFGSHYPTDVIWGQNVRPPHPPPY